MTVVKGNDEDKFPAGRFKKGDRVRLRRPGASAGSFSDPRAALIVDQVLYYRLFAAPTYALVGEDGGIPVVPFTDSDLRRARPTRTKTAQP